MPAGEPLRLLSLLSAPERLRIFSAVVLGATTTDDAAELAGVPAREALRCLGRLERGGLVERRGARWAARPDVLGDAVAAASAPDPPDLPEDDGAGAESVVAAFTRDGRIVAIPVRRSERLLLLDHVARAFEPGIRYTEADVNAVLRSIYTDHATLRRSLVDEGFLDRDTGHYWRCGGTVDL
ncbi:DUF2087 domain-containing protein [Nocardiopsis sediminis]|uniref:DUF2087 domain-containing protein n=1 Tax=Nocardiopsis sediminis TaxID=1778267 RepID=A0ABV8FM55_9ACTN